uniref:Anoctamin n=1 Tax=Plectus sambesii TaxID=2011161 RepID=A0A914XH48_9BILA
MNSVPLDREGEAALKRASTAFFNDGYRQIDFILAYQPDSNSKKRAQKVRFRQKFEASMRREGLELEVEGKENSQDGKTAFVKVHASWEALTRQAELDRIQMPIMASDLEPIKSSLINRGLSAASALIGRSNPFELQPEYQVKREKYFTDAYDRKREEQFLIGDQDHFFTQAQRIYLTWSIISGITISLNVQKRKKRQQSRAKGDILDNESSFSGSLFNEVHLNAVVDEEPRESRVKTANIQYLLSNDIYGQAFPVHDCDLTDSATDTVDWSKIPIERWPKRKYLRTVWGAFRQWHRHQPLDEIRDYFGEKVAIYYAWLGFYTKMLVYPAVFGIFITLWGIWHAFNDDEANSFCKAGIGGADLLICRACRQPACPYINVEDECINARLSAVIDNWGTTIFSVFMAVWVVVFLEQWKRYQSELRVRWDVSENKMNMEQVRPDYALKVNNAKLNPVTQRMEPFLPKRSLLQRTLISISSVVFFMFVVMALISAVMAYKIAGPILWYARLQYKDPVTGSTEVSISPTLLTSITASILNGLFIAVMTKIYMK